MTEDGPEALRRLALELGVSPMTLAQFADAAGSYTSRQSHSAPQRRKLPPRGSVEGMLLAQRIRQECGTEKVRTIANRLGRA